MSLVNVPFQDRWKEKMLEGAKTCTSRTRRYGKMGDNFWEYEREFVIVRVERMTLLEVARDYWQMEGCDSPAGFEAAWIELHRRAGWRPTQLVWVHHFSRITDGGFGPVVYALRELRIAYDEVERDIIESVGQLPKGWPDNPAEGSIFLANRERSGR